MDQQFLPNRLDRMLLRLFLPVSLREVILAGMKPAPKSAIDQKSRWEKTFTETEAFFGDEPSGFSRKAMARFKEHRVRSLLEVGCGQGRDTVFFAGSGIAVTALDYSETAVAEVAQKAARAGLAGRIRVRTHDVRERLPFADQSFDACYSHMLLCMELSTAEIAFILRETWRTLKPGGVALYSVRSNFDKHYKTGTHLAEELYQIGGFSVHFFTESKIRQLSKGYEILEVGRMEEGSLPRDLFCVTMRKGAAPQSWDLDPLEEGKMSDPLGKFQAFMDAALAPGVLDHKTKQLVALGAALAAGCDP